MWLIRDIVRIILLVASEIYSLLTNCRDFRELEQGIFRMVQRISVEILAAGLRQIDNKLMEERDKSRLRYINTKTRTLVTPFGAIEIKRRYYRDESTGERKFLLDETLGIEGCKRLSPWMRELAVKASVEMPYKRAAQFLSTMTLGAIDLRNMTLWQEVQEAGKELAKEAEEKKSLLFEYGVIPEGKLKASSLNIEADEVYVKGRNGKRHAIKIGIGYEGKRETGKDRRELTERRVVSGIKESDSFWEELVAEISEHWKLWEVDEFYLGGDVAKWIKEGCEYFPRAVYRLDPYHLRRTLLEGLGHDEEGLIEAWEAIKEEDLEKLNQTLLVAEKRAKGAKKNRVKAVKKYLNNNWEGICHSKAGVRLGAIEGQVFHHIARRMKRHGAGWSEQGADHLARLLAKKANGELSEALKAKWKTKPEVIKRLVGEKKPFIDADVLIGAKDYGEWLRTTMPVLYGPAQSAPWVKYIMRYLVQELPRIA